jgi:hypothetical protein
MDSKHITLEEFKSILDEQLAPLKTEVVELKAELQEMNKFLEFTNTKYEEI